MLVPNRVRPTIYPLQSHYEVASSVTLSCSVTYPQSDLIDVDTNMILQWSNYSNNVLSVHVGPLTDYATLNYTINNVKLSDAGQYTCAFFIDSAINYPNILASDTIISSINISISKCIILSCLHYFYYIH